MATTIDPTDYVEVENGTLAFSDPKQQAKFELCVHGDIQMGRIDNSRG